MFSEPWFWALMIPILGMVIGLVSVLVKHQQKMAEILNRQPQQSPQEVDALKREVVELKQLVHQQMIQMDSLIQTQQKTPPANEIESRLQG